MIGSRVSHYEIQEKLAEGGMGVVYRARDTKLGRDVAVKVLSEELAADPERLSRFEREARLLASLNHPNIATLHDFEEANGVAFLIMELVEGETLAERIARGRLAIGELVVVFRQIAEGLEGAHQRGILHRDLKPSNVKIGPRGKVKLLDFGLGTMLEQRAPNDQAESPTMPRDRTREGVILGTAPYMSPEQARGQSLDPRTDVWSFGCCLFEASSGKPAFFGETVSDTLARILEREPEWSRLPAETPGRLRDLLERCLAKERENRLHDIADARIDLGRLDLGKSEPAPVARAGRLREKVLAAVALLSSAIALWSLLRTHDGASRHPMRSMLLLPSGEPLAVSVMSGATMALSPDGRFAIYTTGDDHATRLYLHSLDSLEPRLVESGPKLETPFFFSDGAWMGFASDRVLMRAAVSGGGPARLYPLQEPAFGVASSPDQLVFSLGPSSSLFRLAASGGSAEALTKLNADRSEKSHRFPQILPGGQWVLFTIGTSRAERWDDGLIAVGSMTTGEYRVVLEGGSHARYSRSGHIVFARAGSLLAVPFDLERLEVTGRPATVVPDVMVDHLTGTAEFALSETGTLLYAPGRSRTEDRRVVWMDRTGSTETLIEEPHRFSGPRLSPDGRLLAIQIRGALETIAVYDVARGTMMRLTSEWDNAAPLWSPNGAEIAFASARASAWDLYVRTVGGVPAERRIATSQFTKVPTSWSPDGTILAFQEDKNDTGTDILLLELAGENVRPFLAGPANERWAAFSPNGEWIAYESDETGRFEIYVCRFPDCTARQAVSTGGGTYPAWNPNGKELFYRMGDRMMAVELHWGDGVVLGTPITIFEKRFEPTFLGNFDVSPDGRRFVDLDSSVAEPPPTHLVLVQNFDEELKRLVPRER